MRETARRTAWTIALFVAAGLAIRAFTDLMVPVLGFGATALRWVLCFLVGWYSGEIVAAARGDAARLRETWKETTRRGA